MKFLSRFVVKNAVLISLFGTAIAFLGAYYSFLLYKNLHPDIEELLPQSTRSVIDLDEVSHRLKSLESLVVVVTSSDKFASRKFVEALSKNLESVPKNTISLVRYRVGKELQFFRERKSLFVETEDLKKLRDFFSDRIAYEKRVFFNILPEEDLPPKPTLDIEGLRKKYDIGKGEINSFPGGYYATPDEKTYLLIAYLPGKGLLLANRMKEAIVTAVNATNPKSFAPDLNVRYTGNVENLLEESAALIADLEFSTVVVLVLVLLVLLFYFRSVQGTAALLVSLIMGVFWTFGISYYLVSYLNANSAFLASIIVGNGINFGIIYLARYLEERRRGVSHLEATETSMSKTAAATIVAAAASGLSYASLMLTSFRGFNQFGLIGLVGMSLCWISSYTLLPAYLTLFDRFTAWKPERFREPKFSLPDRIASFVQRFANQISYGVLVSIGLSFLAFLTYRSGIIETDLSKLKDKESMAHGSGALYHYIDDVFGHSLSPLVILPRSREEANTITARLREKKARDGASSNFSTIQALDDFIPGDQIAKIKLIQEMRAMWKPTMLNRIAPEDRATVTELLEDTKDLRPFSEKDIPQDAFERFREIDGSVGKIVLFDKTIDTTGSDDAQSIVSFIRSAREVTDSVSPGAPVAGELAIISDMLDSITHDGPRVAAAAFLAVVFLLIVLFRDRNTVFLALFALELGVLWLVAFILAFRLKINFLNFIALPITFGIGVDYGINIFQRYREKAENDILQVVRSTGGAVILCSLTTVIGYGSLLLAGNQAFVSFGRLAVLGELTCIVAAVIALPAFLQWRSLYAKKGGRRAGVLGQEASPQ